MVDQPPPGPTAIATDIADGLHQLAALVRAHPELADTLRLGLANLPALVAPDRLADIAATAIGLGATIQTTTPPPHPWVSDTAGSPEVLQLGRGAIRVLLHPATPTRPASYVPERVTSWR